MDFIDLDLCTPGNCVTDPADPTQPVDEPDPPPTLIVLLSALTCSDSLIIVVCRLISKQPAISLLSCTQIYTRIMNTSPIRDTSPTEQFAYILDTSPILHSLPTIAVRIDIRLFIRLSYQYSDHVLAVHCTTV